MTRGARVGLGLWDRIILLVAWTVTCGLVYVLGFYLGKGTQERQLGAEERVVRLPVTAAPPPAGQRPRPEQDLSFYDELASSRRAAEGVAATTGGPAPRPAESTPPAAPLRVETPPLAMPAQPRPAPPMAAPVPLAAVTPAAAPPAPSRPAAPARPPGSAGVAPVPAAPPLAAAGSPAGGGGWTVEVNPTRSRDEVEALQGQLRRRGYEATVVRVPREGDLWYRLRVGRFATAEQAGAVMRRLRDQEGVTHAFVASE